MSEDYRRLSLSRSMESSSIVSVTSSPSQTPKVLKKKVENMSQEELAKRDRKMARKEELTREHEKIINEIEQTDLGAVQTNIY